MEKEKVWAVTVANPSEGRQFSFETVMDKEPSGSRLSNLVKQALETQLGLEFGIIDQPRGIDDPNRSVVEFCGWSVLSINLKQ
ncbi:hypothetical protein [Limnobacter litoralis]|uniref:Uncharacterized protein n=1 Tax=Limnobacter litoralis TaxID=481366 RepID=A0ABQ5YPK1_9BURK|nr:hypothetical protein [Limnobacter litoralis]GLR26523.1 hypothetical protein GCM10007875_16130 [Limnobacter litoralis]